MILIEIIESLGQINKKHLFHAIKYFIGKHLSLGDIMCTYKYIYIYIYICVCVCVCVYVCVCVCVLKKRERRRERVN